MYRILFLVLFFICSSNLLASSLKFDEHVLFTSDFSYMNENDELVINIQAWVYEKERRPMFTTLLSKYMEIDKDSLNESEYDRLYQRSALFRVDSENGKELKIKFSNGQIFDLPQTEKGGRSSLSLHVKENIDTFLQDNIISFSLYDSGNPASVNEGISYFFSKQGLSIISDIDDTIKDSNVLNKKELLKNTFLYEFKSIPKMNELLNDINRANNTVAFHYVSSSPIQLYPIINEFLHKNGFPKGSVHLKEMTGWDTLLDSDTKDYKLTSIRRILKAYPSREFILIGDSGELDPEIYAQISKENKNQIKKVIIREVTDEGKNSKRYKELFGEFGENFLTIVNY